MCLGRPLRLSLPHPPPSPALPLRLEPADLKRKREQKGKEVVEAGKTHPTQEDKAQRMAKQPKVGQRGAKKRSDPQVAPQAWLPAPMLDGVPLPASASIKDFQGGIADVVEQAFLLLEDMAELRSIRRHEVFLNLKRYLAVVCSPLDLFCLLLFLLFIIIIIIIHVSFLSRLFKPPSRWRR